MDQQIRDLLAQGITALRAGDRATARRYLLELTYRAPTYQDGWLWLSDTTDDLQEQRAYVERVVALDPRSRAGQIAAKKLARLNGGAPPAATPPAALPAAPAAPLPMSSYGTPAPDANANPYVGQQPPAAPPMSSYGTPAPDASYAPYVGQQPPAAPPMSSYGTPAPDANANPYAGQQPPAAPPPTTAIYNYNATPASTAPLPAADTGEPTPTLSLPLLLALGGAFLLLLLLLGGSFWLGTFFNREQVAIQTAEDLLIRFQIEGLEAINPQPVTEADYPSTEMLCAETSRRVDLPTYGAAARIFVCASEQQAQRLREQFEAVTADTPATGTPRLYARDNVLLQIDPSVPVATAAQYAATLVEVLPAATPAPLGEATAPPAYPPAGDGAPPAPDAAPPQTDPYPAAQGGYPAPEPFVPTATPMPAPTAPPPPTAPPAPTAPPFDEEELIATETPPEQIPTATPEVPVDIFPTEPPVEEPPVEEPPVEEPLPEPAPPLVFNGTGQLETGLFRLPAPVSRVQIQHDGSGIFAVRRLTPDDPIGVGLVESEGVYSGSLLQLITPGEETQEYFYAVEADGNWTLVLEAVPEASPPGDIVVGSGDFVSDFFMPEDDARRDYNIRHSKDAPIQIFAHCNDGTEEILILDAEGVLDTIVPIQLGSPRCLWEVLADTDGEWTLEKLP